MTEGAACSDLYCCEPVLVKNGELTRARTGLVMEIPKGHCVEILPRSSMALHGIIIPNSPGVIDSDYRGEVIVLLFGLFVKNFEIFDTGSRIAQARLVKSEQAKYEVADEVSQTQRGSGGFGSTGK